MVGSHARGPCMHYHRRGTAFTSTHMPSASWLVKGVLASVKERDVEAST